MLLGNFMGIRIQESRYLPVVGHTIEIPQINCRKDRRRIKRYARKIRASAKPMTHAYMVEGIINVSPRLFEGLSRQITSIIP